MNRHPEFRDFATAGGPLQNEAAPAAADRRPMDLAKALQYLRRRLRLILGCGVIGGGLSIAAGFLVGPTFTASALLAVAPSNDIAQGATTDSAVDTQIAMLQSQTFLNRAFEALSSDPALSVVVPDISTLEKRMQILQAAKSRLIAVSYSAKSPVLAAAAANKIVQAYVEDPVLQSVQSVDDVTLQYAAHIKALENALAALKSAESPQDDVAASSARLATEDSLRERIAALKLNQSLNLRTQESRRQALAMTPPVQLVALATPPTRRSSLNPIFIAVPGVLFSLLFGAGLAIAIGRFDTRVHTREQLETLVRRKCAGYIPLPPIKRTWRKSAVREQALAYTRAVEALITQTVLLFSPRPRFLLLTATESHFCQRRLAADLAAAAARITPRVLLIDVDFSLERSSSTLFQKILRPKAEGPRSDIFDLLASRRSLEEVLERKDGRGYHFLPLRAPVVDDAFSLLASDRLRHLFDRLSESFDLVIIDGPPVSSSHEAQIVATLADAAVLIVRPGHSHEASVLSALSAAAGSLGLNARSARPQLWMALVETPARDGGGDEPSVAHEPAAVRPGKRVSFLAGSSALPPEPEEPIAGARAGGLLR